jgi:hypothetical protein
LQGYHTDASETWTEIWVVISQSSLTTELLQVPCNNSKAVTNREKGKMVNSEGSSPSLRESTRQHLQAFVSQQEASGNHTAVDVLRAFQQEANCLYETHCIRDILEQDPFQCYSDPDQKQTIQHFQQSFQVTDCHRLEKDDDYCLVEAVVKCHASSSVSPKSKKQKRQSPQQPPSVIQLHFRYERIPATKDTVTSIWYSIDLSQNHGPKENIFTIRCWADGNSPSRLPAVSVDDNKEADGSDNDDDEWEGIDDDDDDQDKEVGKAQQPDSRMTKKNEKGLKVNGTKVESAQPTRDNACNKQQESEEPRDRYACFLDPDVLQTFQTYNGLTEMDQAAGFFTLMAFPFYQQEWDLVGFVLDSVFAYTNDEDDEND